LHISLQFGQNRIDSTSRLLVSPTFSARTLHETGKEILNQLELQVDIVNGKMHLPCVIRFLLLGG